MHSMKLLIMQVPAVILTSSVFQILSSAPVHERLQRLFFPYSERPGFVYIALFKENCTLSNLITQ